MKISETSISGDFYNIRAIVFEPKDMAAKFAIVCMHGFGGDKSSSAIKMLAEGITNSGGAVIAFDFASHGESEADENMLTMENCISDAKKRLYVCRK